MKWCDSLASCGLPIPVEDFICIGCGSGPGILEPIKLPPEAKKKCRPGFPVHNVARCTVCDCKFNSGELIELRLQQAIDDAGLSADVNMDWEMNKPVPDEWPDEDQADSMKKHLYIQSKIVMASQHHDPRHKKTCFEGSTMTKGRKICRFDKPHELVEKTYLDEDMVLQRERPIACNWINPYNDAIMSLLRCNHDVQQLLGGDTPDRTYYTMKYVCKPQQKIENTAVMQVMAYDRRLRKEVSAGQLEPHKRALGRVAALFRNATSLQQFSGQMAAHILLNKACASSSHPFATLNLCQVSGDLYYFVR